VSEMLTYIEKQKLERDLEMSEGRVLGFSNRTFEEFFREVVGIEIYDERFELKSGSKANRMRAFWKVASKKQLLLLFNGLLEAWEIFSNSPVSETTEALFCGIIEKLKGRSETRASHQKEEVNSGDDLSAALKKNLLEITNLSPQKRGYAFEAFLRELFDAYDLAARASFCLKGEQIDGSFVLNNETYLLEAKWEKAPIGAADLHTFEGKLSQKAAWSRGVFISHSGFTPDGLHAFGRAKRTICINGADLWEMLEQKVTFFDVMKAKVRRATETGAPFVPIRDLDLKANQPISK